MDFFDRCWELKIQFENHKLKTYTQQDQRDLGLALDFTVNTGINSTATTGSITVTGMLPEDLAYLATNYIPGTGALRPSAVELSAGYGGVLSTILWGNIFETVPSYTGAADYSIAMKINNGLQQNQLNRHGSVSFPKRITLRDIYENIAKQLGLTLEISKEAASRSLPSYSYQGSPRQHLRDLLTQFPDLRYTDRIRSLRVTTDKEPAQAKYKISPESGLLGTPQPTPQGVSCSCYLLPHLYAQDFIELECVKLKQLNGVYCILTVTHQGSSRGDPWKTSLTLRAVR